MSALLALQKRRNVSFYFVKKYVERKLSLYIRTNTTAKSNGRCHRLQDVKNREGQNKKNSVTVNKTTIIIKQMKYIIGL